MINKIVRNGLFIFTSLFALWVFIAFVVASNAGEIKQPSSTDNELKNYQYYGAAGCVYLMEKNNIPVDDEYRRKVKDTIEDSILFMDWTKTGSSDLAKYICIDHVFSLGMEDILYSELHRRYNEDAGLFDETYHDTYEGMDENTILAMRLASTDAIWTELDAFGLNDSEYDIKQMLADAFNKNLDKYDHNDIYINKWTVTSELENIFYYYLATDSLNLLDYKTVWDVLGSGYVRDLFETNKEESGFVENSVDNMSAILTDNKAYFVLGANITPKYTPQQYFNLLTTAESLAYNPSSEKNAYYEYTIFSDISKPDSLKLSDNAFFKENIGNWLNDNYNNFWEK